MLEQLDLNEIGIHQGNVIRTDQIVFRDEARKYCEQNACRQYGVTWACPPAIGTYEECVRTCLEYPSMYLFSVKTELEDSLDWDGILTAVEEFPTVCDRLKEALKGKLADVLILSNEGCKRCEKCTYPDAPCRSPELFYPALEGYGIMVAETAKVAGINYTNGKDTVTFFGAVLFR